MMDTLKFVQWVYPEAKKITEINPIFTTAQAALESGWGAKAIGKYNLFGITKGNWSGKTELILTHEIFDNSNVKYISPEKIVSITKREDGRYLYACYRLFRVYDSLEESLRDHLKILLSSNFSEDLKYENDPKKYAKAIQEGKYHYATNPDYADIMSEMIDSVSKRINKLGL